MQLYIAGDRVRTAIGLVHPGGRSAERGEDRITSYRQTYSSEGSSGSAVT